ncbi:3-oxo-5-alpha-steroid 4-dehydrogenase-domain-containing protein, partial [Gorgonomyces haynaldii]
MRLVINDRKGKLLKKVEVRSEAKVDELKNEIFKQLKLKQHRQRITIEGKPLQDGKLLESYGIKQDSVLVLKDLGVQIGWKTVFLIEYFGPLLIHTFCYARPDLAYGYKGDVEHSITIIMCYLMVMFHFMKREAETIYVHRFGSDWMPIMNLPKNCFHYWVLGGVFIAYPLYYPHQPMLDLGGLKESWQITLAFLLWVYCQMGNLTTHIMLRHLRPEGTRERNIPKGYLFEFVSCPNYTFEILGWIIFSIVSGNIMSWIFTAIGAGQMAIWAIKKHKRYLAEFKDYPKRRKILIPFVF